MRNSEAGCFNVELLDLSILKNYPIYRQKIFWRGIKMEIEILKESGFEEAITGMRNPLNSWEKSDTAGDEIGEADKNLALKLINAGKDHRKFMRMITVWLDIKAPLYWWKQFDTYKIGTVANSCSTMHKIHSKEFTEDDFEWGLDSDSLKIVIKRLNECREKFLETKDKVYWLEIIKLLPSSYNQKRTVMLNYEVLINICENRKNHKLSEWNSFIDHIAENLKYPELIFKRN